jgi:hypothetical protein
MGFFILNNSSAMDRNPFMLKLVGIVSIVFFGAVGLFVIRKFFDKKAGLIIDQNGLTDQSSGVSVGLIPWSDIVEIETAQVMSTRFLLINVRDAEQYLAKASGIKRRMLAANMKMYGTPLSISSNSLKCNFTELETWVRSGLESSR